jgi:hypothetical protein
MLVYVQRKLNQIPKDVNQQIVGQLGQIKNDDLGHNQALFCNIVGRVAQYG